MTLTIHKEEDSQRQMMLKVEVAEERVQKAMQQAARKLAQEIRVPGFRKGKAPYHVLVRRFGEDAIRAEAVEAIMPQIFEEAISEAAIEAVYGQPRLENMAMKPLVLNFMVPLSPQVTLGDYRAIRKEVVAVTVTEEALTKALEQIQNQYQTLETVQRPSELGDVVTLSGKGVVKGRVKTDEAAEGEAAEPVVAEDEMIFAEEKRDFLLDSSKVMVNTPFVDNLVGMSASEERTFSFVFPEDYDDEALANQEATFTMTVLEVKKRDVPLIDDELAKRNGRYETLPELRESLRQDLLKRAEDTAKNGLMEEMIDDLLKEAQIVYPPTAVELEIDEMIESFQHQVSTSGWKFDDFLRLQNETKESLRENFRQGAAERLQRRLVLRQMILQEKLTVEAEDVEAIIDERVSRYDDNEQLREGMGNYFRTGQGFEVISSEVLSNKVNERIKAIVNGNAPDLAALAGEQTNEDEEE